MYHPDVTAARNPKKDIIEILYSVGLRRRRVLWPSSRHPARLRTASSLFPSKTEVRYEVGSGGTDKM